MFQSFQTKLALFFMALFAVVLTIAVVATQNAIIRNILEQSREQLQAAYAAFNRRIEATAGQLVEGSLLLAADFAFRTAVATNDRATIRTALTNHGSRIGADRIMLVSLDNHVLADTGSARDAAATGNIVTLGDDLFSFPAMIEEADVEGEATRIAVLDGRICQTVVVPIMAPVAIAWIVVFVDIGDSFASEMRLQSAVPMDITFGFSELGAAWVPAASTLTASLREAVAPLVNANESAAAEPTILSMAGSDYVTLIAALPAPEVGPHVNAVLQYSLDVALRPYRPLFLLLYGLAGGALGLTLLGSIFIARGVTKPLRVLDDAARRIKGGRYDEKVPVTQQDEIGRLSETFNQMMEGISQREEKIAFQARHDALTGLPNRIAFEGHVSDLIIGRREQTRAFSVMLIQIGRFSEINNTLGHDNGEQLIRKIGRNLQRLVPAANGVARHTNNMFAVVLDTDDRGAISQAVERILATFEHPVPIAGLNIDVSASIGEACYPEHGTNARILLQRADTAIFEAKKRGRPYAVYDADQDPHKPERLSMMGELRHGLDRAQFKFFFQPKVDIGQERITAVEALIRWIHPERGFMPPDLFIPLAEQTGNIQKVTAWALDAAIKQARDWASCDIDVRIAVNLSAHDLGNRRLPDHIAELLARYGVTPGRIMLEITESAVMEDPANALEVMTALNNMGLSLSVDDYGIGYSSLAYLKRLPVQEIKIDKSFVLKLASNKNDEIVVRSTIDLGRNLGLKVTAEGIEDQAALEMLKAYGCQTGQGYFISKPIPAEEFERFYWSSRWSPVKGGRARAAATGPNVALVK